MLPEIKKNSQRSEIVLKKARDLGESTTLLTDKAVAIALSSLYGRKARLVLQKYATLTKLVSKNHFINQEIEFIFDNFFIVESTVSEIANSFKEKDVRKLPLVSLRGVKMIRLYSLLEEFLAVTENKVDRAVLLDFLAEYQKESPLSIQEINLVPVVLRLLLVENFGSLMDEAFKKIQDFNEADKIHTIIKKSIASAGGDPSRAISFLASRYKFIPFNLAVHLLGRLSKEGAAMRLVIKWIHLNLEKQGIGANKISSVEKRIRGKRLAASANAIESLHWLSQAKWDSIAEKINVVDAILADDPERVFSSLERESKNIYRNTIVRIAERVSVHEAEVARAALNLALKARPKGLLKDMAARRHIGYYLMDRSGIEMLEREMRYVPGKLEGFYKLVINHPQAAYFGSIGVFSSLFFFFIFLIIGIPNFGIAFFVLWLLIEAMFSFEIGIHAANSLFSQFLPVRSLPRIKIEGGAGKEYRTFVAVPSILRSEGSIRELAQKLEVKFLGNREKNIFFALLFDFKDAAEETLGTDAVLLDAMNEEISRLNSLYGNGSKRFFGLARKRIWNEKEGIFMGWERKRGKLREFNELLRGKKDTSYINGEGVLSLGRIKYVITLDEDTELPHDTARKLIGTIMHPLNAPVIDASDRIVRGYGIIQPRIAVHIDTAFRSFFSRLYSSGSGIDSYSISVSNFYQDLFGKALFFGKGIYDIDAVERSMSGKIPDNAVLSHDLLEGIYAHTGFASDIILFDGFPNFYHEFIVRLERWIRGDWQIIGWLSGRFGRSDIGSPRESFAFIDKFKIIDNLRRSLVPIICAFTLFLGFAAGPDPIKISALVLIVLASPNIFPFLISLAFLHSIPFRQRLPKAIKGMVLIFEHTALKVFFLLQQAYISMRAIITTLFRLYLTRKNLLQWKNFYDVGTAMTGRLEEYYFVMKESVAISLFFLAFFIVRGSIDPWPQAWLIIWLAAPAAAFLISRPIRAKERLDKKDVPFVRTVAYRNALYFLENAKEETNWLIPDHVQEYPKLPERSRMATSPTNIGMHVISLVSALDLGYVSPLRYADRTEKLFLSISRLYRYRGNLINWYDTRSLEPLSPQYVSSVDSANFLLSLVAARQAYAEMPERLIAKEVAFEGLIDATSAFIQDALSSSRTAPGYLRKKIREMIRSSRRIIAATEAPLRGDASLYDHFKKLSFFHEGFSEILKKIQEIPISGFQPVPDQLLFSIEKAIEITEDHMMSLQTLVPYIKHRDPSVGLYASQDNAAINIVKKLEDLVFSMASIREIAERRPLSVRELEFEKNISKSSLRDEAKEFLIGWYKKLLEDVDLGAEAARNIIFSLHEAEISSARYVSEADLSFLYNKEKELFHIGYNITLDKIDSACYNFIASEANSVSFMAILKGDAPQKHWFYLSRKLARSGRSISLVSWGGSLFEYLTSLIFFPVHPESLLGSTARSAIRIHMQEGRQRNIPWGMGESAYYQFDENRQYQYQIFGSPKIGLKRNLIDFLVVAPYAAALSMPFFPREAVRNLKEFSRAGCEGRYGFYDSLDYFGSSKKKEKAKPAKVYYAHHQGFTLASLANILEGGRIQDLFHSNPMVRSLDHLFEEKMPDAPIAEKLLVPVSVSFQQNKTSHFRDTGLESKRFMPMRTTLPRHAFISNGSYSIRLTSGGASTSLYKGIALTRPSLDEDSEAEGPSFFLQDKKTKNIYALSPRGMQYSRRQKVIFHENKAEFLSFSDVFDSALSVSVDPRLPIEVRKISIRNNGKSSLNLDLMAYAEASLAFPDQIFHHPHYHHLLVKAEIITKENAVIFHRPHPWDRTKNIYCAQMLISENFLKNPSVLTASRGDALDRFAQNPSFPSLLQRKKNERYSSPIDPASRIVSGLEILPGESASAAWIQIAAESYREIRRLVRKYRRCDLADAIVSSAVPSSASSTRALGISQEQSVIFQDIASQVLTGSMKGFLHGGSGETLIHYLWKIGISGNYPVALFFIHDVEDMQILKQAIQCYEYWKSKGIEIDIVILNDQPGSYLKVLDDEVDLMIRQAKDNVQKKEGSSIYQAKSDLISSEDREAIVTIARFVMDSKKGTLSETVEKKYKARNTKIQKFVPSSKPFERKYPGVVAPHLLFNNSWGGFDDASSEYVMTVSSDRMPPQPWSHIIAFEEFGTVVSDSGSSYTWSKDSHDNRITAWTNDVLRYRSGEIIYLRDDDTGEIWNPTPLPVKTKEPFLIRYGFGYASYENSYSDMEQKLTAFVPCGDTVKISLLSLKNKRGKDRCVTLYYYLEPSTGILRDNSRDRIFFNYDRSDQVMFFGNEFRNQLPGRTAFASFGRFSGEAGWTNDKREFIGRFGSYESPQSLKKGSLSNSAECGLENCVALSLKINIPAGEEVEIPIFVGDAPSFEEAREKVLFWKNRDRYDNDLVGARDAWKQKLNKISVRTGDRSLDLLMNGWLLYQTLSSRVYAKTGFYQPSGAYGFRDQLQDVCALIWSDPSFVREFILKAASHQFKEGDSLNWWHDHNMFGIRTVLSDHQLWLAYTLFEYVKATGDVSIFDEEASFLEGPILSFAEKKEWTGIPEISSERAPIFEHAMRAIEKNFVFGAHGLPLIGLSDWNDGLSRVGDQGKGESVWVAWFLLRLIDIALPQLKERGQIERMNKFADVRAAVKRAIGKFAWDKQWYRRAFFDDGSVLGSRSLKEFKIDSVAQSWAALSGQGDEEKIRTAHRSMSKMLFKEKYFSLIDPAIKKDSIDPGYIRDYPAGIRENGSQYNHAALWAVQSYSRIGEVDIAERILRLINPIERSGTEKKAFEYRIEPYVVASDIYGEEHAGRGGWSWYSGSSGLMYTTILEHILGIQRKGSILSISPRTPKSMNDAAITLPCGKASYNIAIKNPKGAYSKVLSAFRDNIECDPSQISFIDDGADHQIEIILG
ncbi:MAG: glucoamylase family protein [Candidatus Paceibacterota bacterium]